MINPRKLAKFLLASALAVASAAPCAFAQTQPDDNAAKQPEPCPRQSEPSATKTFYLANTNTQQDESEIQVALRNMLCPSDKLYLVSLQSAIVVQAPPDQLDLAQKLIAELDRPKRAYRLTFTVTELDADKNVGTQHYSMVVVTGQRTSMKEGTKIPVVTGSYSNGVAVTAVTAAGIQTQFTYLDIGMNFDATIAESANNVRLQSKVEQSSLGPPSTIAGVEEPVVRQTVLEGTSFLTLGKPVMLGSIDVPNSTRRFDIDVVMDQVK